MAMTRNHITRVILLTSVDEAAILGDILRTHNKDLDVVGAHDRPGIEKACAEASATTRLISFCSSAIVPGTALEALPGPAYNFHPGPPSRPGRYPSVFALYDGDTRFGITVHEMLAKVDSGPIVAIDWFDFTPVPTLPELEKATYLCLAAMFRKLARPLATQVEPLPHIDATWSGRKTKLADVTALSQVTPGMPEAEIERRRRACGRVIMPNEDPGWPT